MSDLAYARRRMVELVRTRGVRDERVLAALAAVPRHRFVKTHLVSRAYGDHALPIGLGQTISQPWVVARMSELLEVEPHHRVLEIGTGSGYQTAVLAQLARWVFSLERIAALARAANGRIRELGIENVQIQPFDGSIGWSEVGPFDRILVTAGAPQVPGPLLDQLAEQGRLVVPEGDRRAQRLVVYRRDRKGRVHREEGEGVTFVPLIGRFGWTDEGKTGR